MNKPPPRRKTTKTMRRSDGDAAPVTARDADTMPPRDRKTTTPDLPRARKNSKTDGKAAAAGAESARPRKDSKAPESRRDSKAGGKRTSAPPRGKRESKAPRKELPGELDGADLSSVKLRVDAPFRVTGELPAPEATRYSVIPSPRSAKPKKPEKPAR